ncbi:MAG: hypothetical protein ACU837_12500 [Gammaproteobacteria bacterium]
MITGEPESNLITEKRKFQLEEAILILMLILSLIGIGITDYSPADGYWYWIIMIGVFCIAAIFIGWMQSKRHIKDFKKLFLEQIFHWSSSMLIVGAVFSLLHAGRLYPASAGLVIMLVLSLATFLDGLRVGWRFSMNGLFLGVSAVIVGYVERFMWIEILLAVGIVALTFLVDYWRERSRAV